MEPTGYELDGKVAIVTGGGTGIGKATALLLARYGADIVIAGRTESVLRDTSAEIESATGRKCLAVPTDAHEEEQVQRMVARTMEAFGRVDILSNNVGWGDSATLSQVDYEAWRFEFTRNVDPAFFCTKAVGPHMREQGSGAIVHNSSVAGVDGVAGMTPYSVSKAALVMFTRVAAAEWGQYGIRINAVAPGLITTENAMVTYDANNIDPDVMCANRPLRRAGTAHDVAKAICFLASDAASYITGETIEVSGGPVVGGQGG
ncbi:MAG: SDR family NAD(P)-dependent oxidoreductase [Novosphingobium sp.]|nr:SDR family NAD(P)-dependent oxidoreductase [Novosphingobium sp.]